MAVTLTKDGEQTLTYFNLPIEKIEENADGDVVVWGKATDGTVDADEQIVDLDWSARSLKTWLDSYANIRLQHNAMRPVGKGMEIEITPDGHWVKALVVETEAKNLVKKGVLSAYSVGIARPQVVRDIKARGGRINGGELVEISLVDRPANKQCGFTLVKADSTGTPEWVGKVWGSNDVINKVGTEPSTVNINLPSDVSVSFSPADLAKVIAQRRAELTDAAEKRNFDSNVGGGVDRDKLSDSDFAGRNRSFPIVNQSDVSDALRSIGRAGEGNYDAATLRSRIHAIARRKGFSVPDSDSKPKKKSKKATKGMDYDSNVMSHLEDIENALNEAKHDQSMDMDLPEEDDDGTLASSNGSNGDGQKADKQDSKPPMRDDDDDDDDDDAGRSSKGFFPDEGTFPPDVMTALRYKSVGAPFEMGMIHDFTCPAFDPDDVAKSHPHGGLSTIDDGGWQRQAIDMASGGSLEAAKLLSTMWSYARTLKTADSGDSTVLRYQMHKAFQDANPGPGHAPVPSGQIHPGSYNRPLVTDGHAAGSSGHQGPNSAKVPTESGNAQSYTRGPITAGHADEGPGYDHGHVGVTPPSSTGHLQPASFGSIPRSNLLQAMGAMHGHIAQTFPDLCPLKPEGAFPAHSNPVPTPGSTPSATAAKTDKPDNDDDDDDDKGKPPWLNSDADKKKGDLKPEGKPKKGGKLPTAAPVADMDDDASVSVAEPDVGKAVTAYLDKLLTSVPPTEHPAPATQDDIKSGVRDALADVLREEPVQPITQSDVKKAVSAAVKKAMTATTEREQMQEAVASVPVDIRADIKAALDEVMREQPVTQADIKTAVLEAIETTRPKPEPAAPMTAADIKKAVSSAMKKADRAPAPAPAPAPVVTPQSAPVDRDALARLTEPLQERIRQQEKRLWKQEKALRKQKMNAAFSKYQIPAPEPAPYQEPMVPAPAVPEFDMDAAIAQMAAHMPKGVTRDDLASFAEPLLQRLEIQERLIRKQEKQMEKQVSQPQVNVPQVPVPQVSQGLTRDDLAVFAEPLLQRLELQEKLIRKQEKRLEKQQLQQFMEHQQQSQPVVPAPSPDVTRQMIEELTSKLQSQPGVTEEAIKQITAPLISRLETQEKLLQDRLDRDNADSPVLAKLDAQDEAVREISKHLAAQPEAARDAIKEATSPLLSRLEAQEEMLRRQERKLRKSERQRRDDMSAASLREQLMAGAAPQPVRGGIGKSANLSELSVPLLERMKTQEKLIRKQQKQLEKQQEQLSSLDGIAKTVDAMAGMPDPNLAPFRGVAQNNINKAQGSARPVGASSVADVAERTQVMMLRELEQQFRTTADPAQREAAWKTIVKMRGLPEGTSPFQ